jgi:hypothetical protein
MSFVSVRIACVESAKPCGPRSNIDLTYYVWSKFDYYRTNYAMIVLPSHTADNKIIYACHFKPDLGGEFSALWKLRMK